MMGKVVRWTIIRDSGNTQIEPGEGSTAMVGAKRSYLDILQMVYVDMMSGGSVYDRPNMLLADGKIVVQSDLSKLAYKYGTARKDAIDAAVAKVNKEYDRSFD